MNTRLRMHRSISSLMILYKKSDHHEIDQSTVGKPSLRHLELRQ